jgi:hypothetical protein
MRVARKAAKRKPLRKPRATALGPDEALLLSRLAERTGHPPREVLQRALAAYAAAVAPGMPLVARAAAKALRGGARQRLFVSVEGKPEVEIKKSEFVFGRDPSCDVALDVALVSPRHARVLFRDGEPVFEDLRSQRGTFHRGERIDVKAIRDGDEFDLGGFVPVRFRIAPAKDAAQREK